MNKKEIIVAETQENVIGRSSQQSSENSYSTNPAFCITVEYEIFQK